MGWQLQTLILLCGVLLGVQAASDASSKFQRLSSALKSFTSYSYDEIHQRVVLDQVEDYLKPVKSLGTREVRSLNGLYDFCFDPELEGFRGKFFERPLVDACREQDFHRMPVPSAFNEILSNKTAKNYVGWMWYQTSVFLDAPERSLGGRSNNDIDRILQIESINYLSIIWATIIDESKSETRLIGAHAGGHLPITMNISSLLARQERFAKMRLTIAVSNLLSSNTIPSGQLVNMTSLVGRPFYKFQPDFDFFNFAGIMGDVQIITLSSKHIEHVKHSPSNRIDDRIQLEICLNVAPSYNLTLEFFVDGFRGRLESLSSASYLCMDTAESPCDKKGCFLSHIDPLEVWPIDIGRPSSSRRRVKRLHITLIDTLLNTHLDSFEFKLMPHQPAAVRLQGRQLQGFGTHHEQLFSGRTMSLAAIMKDLYLIKQMGANVIRTSHYPYSRAYLEACDELGLMVIAEAPAVGLSTFSDLKLTLHKQILLEMMERDHEHPAIVMWSLANEPQSQLPEARAYFKSLTQFARTDLERFTVKAGRPLTAAIAQSHLDDTIGDLLDVIMINRYYGWYECTGLIECVRHSLLESLMGWGAKYGPKKPLIVSEFGADTLAGLHSSTSEIFSEEYQRELVLEHEKVFDELASNASTKQVNFIGSMIWNFADFSTHDSLLRVGGNKKGLFTRSREPKLVVDSVRRIYTSRRGLSGAGEQI